LTTNWLLTISTVGEDDTWLSPQYGRTNTAFSFKIVDNFEKVDALTHQIEKFFARFEGRQHWATIHHKTHKVLKELFPKLEDFKIIREKFDPKNIFVNEHISQIFGLDTN